MFPKNFKNSLECSMSQEVLIIHFQTIISLSITSLKAFRILQIFRYYFDIHGNTLNNTTGSHSDVLELWKFWERNLIKWLWKGLKFWRIPSYQNVLSTTHKVFEKLLLIVHVQSLKKHWRDRLYTKAYVDKMISNLDRKS